MNLVARSILLACLLALSASAAAQAAKPWTIMVYMMAENDLEESAVDDLGEMAAAGAGELFDLVVLADRGSMYTAAPAAGIPAWSGAKLLLGGKSGLTVLADWGKTDMGDPATLERFITEVAKNRPARRYALVFWDHGGAWLGFGADESGSPLSPEELATGLEKGLKKAGIAKLDLLGFDACLMASFEIMSRLGPYASYFLASEELEPGHGWDYRSLTALSAQPGAGPRELGIALIRGYMAQAREKKSAERATLSLVDLGALPKVEKALGDFAALVRRDPSSFAADLGRSAGKALAFGKSGSPEQDSAMVDIGALAAAAAKENPALQAARAALDAALASAVVAKESGDLLKASTGISIYFPGRKKYYDARYDGSGHPAWRALLESCFNAGAEASAPAPRFEAEENLGEAAFGDEGITLTGRLAEGTAQGVVESTFYYGIVEDDLAVLLGDSDASFDPESGIAEGFWDRSVLLLRQDGKETFGYLSAYADEEGDLVLSIPFAYFKDGRVDDEDWDYSYIDLVVDGEGEVLSSALYKEDDEGMTSPLRPIRGSKLVPLVETLTVDGESSLEMTEDWGFDARRWEEIALDFSQVEAGSLVYLELTAADAGEGYDYVYYEGTGE
jgi:hypothetical protein